MRSRRRLVLTSFVLAVLAALLLASEFGWNPEVLLPATLLFLVSVPLLLHKTDSRLRWACLIAGVLTLAIAGFFAPVGGVPFLPSAVLLLVASAWPRRTHEPGDPSSQERLSEAIQPRELTYTRVLVLTVVLSELALYVGVRIVHAIGVENQAPWSATPAVAGVGLLFLGVGYAVGRFRPKLWVALAASATTILVGVGIGFFVWLITGCAIERCM